MITTWPGLIKAAAARAIASLASGDSSLRSLKSRWVGVVGRAPPCTRCSRPASARSRRSRRTVSSETAKCSLNSAERTWPRAVSRRRISRRRSVVSSPDLAWDCRTPLISLRSQSRSPFQACLVVDAVARRRLHLESLVADGAAAHLANAVASVVEAGQRRLHLLQLPPHPLHHPQVPLALQDLAADIRRKLVPAGELGLPRPPHPLHELVRRP